MDRREAKRVQSERPAAACLPGAPVGHHAHAHRAVLRARLRRVRPVRRGPRLDRVASRSGLGPERLHREPLHLLGDRHHLGPHLQHDRQRQVHHHDRHRRHAVRGPHHGRTSGRRALRPLRTRRLHLLQNQGGRGGQDPPVAATLVEQRLGFNHKITHFLKPSLL